MVPKNPVSKLSYLEMRDKKTDEKPYLFHSTGNSMSIGKSFCLFETYLDFLL